MKKFFTLIAVALFTAALCAAPKSYVRVDIDGRNGKVELKPLPGKTLDVLNAGWLKENFKKFYLTAASKEPLTDKWQKFEFSFIPENDGRVSIAFRGAWYKPKDAKENIPVWTAYDNITITGAELKNTDFEDYGYDVKGAFDGWGGDITNMLQKTIDAQSGKNYIVVWHNKSITQSFNVKKGETITITFYAKASDKPEKIKTTK